VMAEAMRAADKRGVPLVLTVHDELIAETRASSGDKLLGEMLALMKKPPKWAPGLPVAGEGWAGERYRK
ncbi:MAG: hypothetical protein K8F25_10550, partial [Fimbriimonadaceae bacterium]|nr:hypothetical protein [Alphaproteobacteria bacterium]